MKWLRGLIFLGYLTSFFPNVTTQWLAFVGLILKFFGVLLNAPGLLPLVALQGGTAVYGPLRLLAVLLTLALLEWVARRAPQAASPEPASLTRRVFLTGAAGGVVGLSLAGYGYGVERSSFQLRLYRLAVADLPAELEGLRVCLMADWHLGPFNRPEMVDKAVQLCNQARPDLIFLPGDFVSQSGRYFSEVAELVRELKPNIRGGLLGCWGNHDYWHGIEPGLQLLPQAGLTMLTNQRLLLTPGRELRPQGERGLWLAGLDDFWAGRPDLQTALQGLPPQQPRLLLNHNPDLAETSFGPRVDLMFSGHTHGGQIYLPGLGPPVLPSAYGQKYASGWVQAPGYPVFVTKGVGTSGLPLRLGVPPEVVIFELVPGKETRLS